MSVLASCPANSCTEGAMQRPSIAYSVVLERTALKESDYKRNSAARTYREKGGRIYELMLLTQSMLTDTD